jgi:hypothetical protein
MSRKRLELVLAKPNLAPYNDVPMSNPEAAMPIAQSTGRDGNTMSSRAAWDPPAFTELALCAQTRSSDEAMSGAAAPVHPAPPCDPPMAKLGFSLESSFPLSARTK